MLNIFILDHKALCGRGKPWVTTSPIMPPELVEYKYRLTSLCARCYSYRMVVIGYAVFFVFPHSAPCMRLSSHTALPR